MITAGQASLLDAWAVDAPEVMASMDCAGALISLAVLTAADAEEYLAAADRRNPKMEGAENG
jgi:hypothetical protein